MVQMNAIISRTSSNKKYFSTSVHGGQYQYHRVQIRKIICQAKYQAKVDELAKMRRSASPDPAKVNAYLKTQWEPNSLKLPLIISVMS